ncbi:universal stress protein [Actinomycetospora endophytica]|uniref:Universal stress protein n=1 Tax=Actinomycetospora endophytica TaxID=2291215 RepID=A0ABS8PAF1_9PSEU|nr:universal stress protein [Actinomycetospora endophytica]MCD2195263.1 universal stress protein [Actinomycetospora endophytica]
MSTGTVVVGVDGSPHADAALRYALEEAARRGASVRAVMACRPPEMWMYAYDLDTAPSPERTRAAARTALEQRIEAVRAAAGRDVVDVPVEPVVSLGSPVPVLVDAARDAELLVVGHRGRGPWRSGLLGSVGLGTLLHAPCTVTVVPSVRGGDPDSVAVEARASAS